MAWVRERKDSQHPRLVSEMICTTVTKDYVFLPTLPAPHPQVKLLECRPYFFPFFWRQFERDRFGTNGISGGKRNLRRGWFKAYQKRHLSQNQFREKNLSCLLATKQGGNSGILGQKLLLAAEAQPCLYFEVCYWLVAAKFLNRTN